MRVTENGYKGLLIIYISDELNIVISVLMDVAFSHKALCNDWKLFLSYNFKLCPIKNM